MTTLVNLLLLPLRAPLLLVLLLISVYLGLHWSRPGSVADSGMGSLTTLIWSAECLQAVVVVVICTIPELLLQRLSSLMAASRVASLVVTLLLVITGGLYLLHLEVLSNVLILASAVLLARLDLVRLRVVPPPFVMTLVLCVLVLGGVSLGRSIEMRLRPLFTPAAETRTESRTESRTVEPRRQLPAAAPGDGRAPTLNPESGAAQAEPAASPGPSPRGLPAQPRAGGAAPAAAGRAGEESVGLADPLPSEGESAEGERTGEGQAEE